jgi:hypothetical protein
MIAKGDKYAIEVFNQYNKMPLMSYSYLKDDEI